jgi:hypothetical protein
MIICQIRIPHGHNNQSVLLYFCSVKISPLLITRWKIKKAANRSPFHFRLLQHIAHFSLLDKFFRIIGQQLRHDLFNGRDETIVKAPEGRTAHAG